MLKAELDPALAVRILGWRDLRYSEPQRLGDDRPPHVRAASGLAFTGGRLAVIQDDVSFIAMVGGPEVAAIALPRGEGGRRRFEVELGNKHEKLDLEACVAIGDDLFAFGSGSMAARERVVHVGYGTRVQDASPLYRRLRDEIGGEINIEGVAIVTGESTDARADAAETSDDAGYSGALSLWPGVQDESGRELWFFHRGNTGPADRGPAVVRFGKTPLLRWLLGNGPVPEVVGSARFDLGTSDGVRYGFTDAVGRGDRVFYIAAAEDSLNAIDDGRVLGSQLGVIGRGAVRYAPLVVDGVPVKAEGLAFDPADPSHAWIAIDPDDVGTPARLYEVALTGNW
jgi:hypothetical protein